MERVGLSDIKAGFDMYESCPYFALYEKSNGNSTRPGQLLFAYKEDDKQAGWNLLEQNLQVLEQSAPTIMHIIQFYDKLTNKGDLGACTGSFRLRMKPADTYVPAISGIGGQTIQADNSFLTFLQNELRFAKEKIEDQERTIADQDELIRELEEDNNKPAEKQIGGILGVVGEFGQQYPWAQKYIDKGFGILAGILSPNSGNQEQQRQGHAMAGIPDDLAPDERIKQAIKILAAWYNKEYAQEGKTAEENHVIGFTQFSNDMMGLAELTKNTPMMKMALGTLRSMKSA